MHSCASTPAARALHCQRQPQQVSQEWSPLLRRRNPSRLRLRGYRLVVHFGGAPPLPRAPRGLPKPCARRPPPEREFSLRRPPRAALPQAGPGAGFGVFSTAAAAAPRHGAPWWSWLWPHRGGGGARSGREPEPTTLASFPLDAAITARTACRDPQVGPQFRCVSGAAGWAAAGGGGERGTSPWR